VGGVLDVQSDAGAGTRIIFKVPINGHGKRVT
jgi:hypothetical protein